MYLNRKRTTFHDATSLAIHNSVEFYAYGPETASVYPIVSKLVKEARDEYHKATLPIIMAAREKFPKIAWWKEDNEFSKKYQQCWESYKFWRSEAFAMMKDAACADTDRFFRAQEQHQPQPFLVSPTPRSAFEWLLEFGAMAWEMFTDDSHEV